MGSLATISRSSVIGPPLGIGLGPWRLRITGADIPLVGPAGENDGSTGGGWSLEQAAMATVAHTTVAHNIAALIQRFDLFMFIFLMVVDSTMRRGYLHGLFEASYGNPVVFVTASMSAMLAFPEQMAASKKSIRSTVL